MNHEPMTRRAFLGRVTLASAAVTVLGPAALRAESERPHARLFAAVGVAAPLRRAAELKAAGADFLVESVGGFLQPDRPEADFALALAELASSPLCVKACNSFLRDPALHCVGPEANHGRILAWSQAAFRRARRAGVEFIVFGSAGARRLPAGWERARADEQFVALLKAMGPLADAEGITVAVEPLQRRECNYLMRLSEVAAVVRSADHPRIRALADLYHMANMGEPPADLTAALPVVHWVEIAEKERRTAPGVAGDDFRGYFRALAEGGYVGGITIEGQWTVDELRRGIATIRGQARDVFA